MKVEWSNLQQGTGVTGKIIYSLWLHSDHEVSIAQQLTVVYYLTEPY